MAAERRVLNIGLWIVQVVLGLMFLMAGSMKSMTSIPDLSAKMSWVPHFPEGFVRFIGVAEVLGGLGLLLPSLTRIMPRLTALAGICLLIIMLGGVGTHIAIGEYDRAPIPLVLAIGAGFVAWGRGKAVPIAAR